MKIPLSIYRAKDCTDLSDVEITLDALRQWCISIHKKSPDEIPIVTKRWNALIKLRYRYKTLK